MNWIIGSSEVLVGLGMMALWVLLVRLFRGDGTKELTAMGFVFVAPFLLLWMATGLILIAHGAGIL